MPKLCPNCHMENPADAVSCSACGIGLRSAPTAESAPTAREGTAQVGTVPAIGEHPAERTVGRLRRVAGVLAIGWAVCLTLVIVWLSLAVYRLSNQVSLCCDGQSTSLSELLVIWVALAPLLLPLWVPTLTAQRWPTIGGTLLVVEGLLLSIPICLARWISPVFDMVAQGGIDFTQILRWGALDFSALLVSTPPLVAGLLFLASFSRSAERKEGETRMFRWLCGGLALASMAWWSAFVVWYRSLPIDYFCQAPWYLCDPAAMNTPALLADYSYIHRTTVLALAPWIIGGIVLGIVLVVCGWRSRASEGPEDTNRTQ